jgi:hypothetical protein
MARAPKSYVDRRRPPLADALRAEGDVTLEEAIASLERKGYFTPRPGPWKLGFCDRGMGRRDYVVLDRFGDPVTPPLERVDADLIITAVNAFRPRR